MNNDVIELISYDPQWPVMAAAEIKKIAQMLPSDQLVDIQHVGSTAIPGMLAKPVIDIQVAVKSLAIAKPLAIDIFKKNKYVFWDKNPDSERLLFIKGLPPFGEKRTHHIHIVEHTSKHWRDKIFFRDYLIAHPKDTHEYTELKIMLAEKYRNDREQYTNGKAEFIQNILKKANS